MKKILLIFLILFCVNLTYSAVVGDSLGDHKAKRQFNMNLQNIINGRSAGFTVLHVTGTITTNIVIGTTITARGVDGLWLRTDGLTGGFEILDSGGIKFYGSTEYGGRDITGVDNITATGITCDNVDGVDVSALAESTGTISGADANKGIAVNSFYRPAEGRANTAAIAREEMQRTYEGFVSTRSIWIGKLPDDKLNYLYWDGIWKDEWNNGGTNAVFVTSGTSVGNAWVEVWITTSCGVTWTIGKSTTAVQSDWCNFAISTFTASTFSFVDGTPYTGMVRRNGDDSCAQRLNIISVEHED